VLVLVLTAIVVLVVVVLVVLLLLAVAQLIAEMRATIINLWFVLAWGVAPPTAMLKLLLLLMLMLMLMPLMMLRLGDVHIGPRPTPPTCHIGHGGRVRDSISPRI
jgi:hypothetical protein